jgi:hypothetical protein
MLHWRRHTRTSSAAQICGPPFHFPTSCGWRPQRSFFRCQDVGGEDGLHSEKALAKPACETSLLIRLQGQQHQTPSRMPASIPRLQGKQYQTPSRAFHFQLHDEGPTAPDTLSCCSTLILNAWGAPHLLRSGDSLWSPSPYTLQSRTLPCPSRERKTAPEERMACSEAT